MYIIHLVTGKDIIVEDEWVANLMERYFDRGGWKDMIPVRPDGKNPTFISTKHIVAIMPVEAGTSGVVGTPAPDKYRTIKENELIKTLSEMQHTGRRTEPSMGDSAMPGVPGQGGSSGRKT